MNDWYSLGVALRVHPNKLQEIQNSSQGEGIQQWRMELLQHWLNSTPGASWSMIVVALGKIGHHALAARLSEKYQVPQIKSGTTLKLCLDGQSHTEANSRCDVSVCMCVHKL